MSHSNQAQGLLVRKATLLQKMATSKSAVERMCLAESMAEIDAEVSHHQREIRRSANVVRLRIVKVA